MGLSLHGLARAPYCIKQSMTLKTRTVDEEFEEINIEFEKIVKDCLRAVDLMKGFQLSFSMMVDCSHKVGLAFKHMIIGTGPADTLPPALSQELDACKRYVAVVESADLGVTEIFQLLLKTAEARLNDLLKCIGVIQQRIGQREMALLDCDKMMEKLDLLSLKRAHNALTVGQTQQFLEMEHKLEDRKKVYDKHNLILKMELPYFFRLAQDYLVTWHKILFYLQISLAYQLCSDFSAYKESPSTDDTKSWGEKLMKEFPEPKKPDLAIVSFHTTYLEHLVEDQHLVRKGSLTNIDPLASYCRALFDYLPSDEADLGFRAGDIIKIVAVEGEWYKGELHGKVGMLPANYVEKYL